MNQPQKDGFMTAGTSLGHPCRARRRCGNTLAAALFLAVLLIFAISPCTLWAQAPSPSSPTPGSSTAPAQPDSGAPTMETPLPSKVLGQVPPTAKYTASGEITDILQDLFDFHSPYSGTNSLRARNEAELSHSYTLYLGARLTPRLEVYVNPEIALGNGVGSGSGLAGYPNGDLIGQPTLRPDPYLARLFVRWRIPLQSRAAPKQKQNVKPGNDVIGGSLPASRLVILAGKLAISDHFDVNTYANNARLQFLNNAFVNNLAYDKAADPRGYNHGLVVSIIRPALALRLGSIAMPTTAGGSHLAYSLAGRHSEQLELELHPRLLAGHGAQPLIVRVLAYRNQGTMGRYQEALQAAQGAMPPDVTTVRRRGAFKYGFGLNFEQKVGDRGATGLFGRLGWNDGRTESFSYAEADRFASLGGQVSGAHWGRAKDVLGAALAQSDLSGPHKAYLAAGGLGLSLGDGTLRYGSERIAEVYYAYQLSGNASLSPDYQFVSSPGCNRDRGPVSLLTLRLHLTF